MELLGRLIESIKRFIQKFTKKKPAETIRSSNPVFVKKGNEPLQDPAYSMEKTDFETLENDETENDNAISFGKDLLEELKNDRALQLEDEYAILKLLDDVSAAELVNELNQTLILLKNKKIQQHRIVVQYRYSIFMTDSR